MDPLSLTLTIVNIFAIADNCYRGAKLLRRLAGDPRVDGLYVRLITENARFAEWKRRMGIVTNKDIKTLIERLPEDARRTLPIILEPMMKYINLSEELFKKYRIGPSNASNRSWTLKDRIRRFDLQIDGKRQLDEILATLKDCNDGLVAIAPPAPGYYVSLTSNDQILETSGMTHSPEIDSAQQLQPPESSSSVSSAADRERRTEPTMEHSQNVDAVSGAAQKTFHPLVELLYSTCMNVLGSMMVQHQAHKGTIQAMTDRLRVWETGLFTGHISIDQALNQNRNAVVMLRSNIVGILADIAVILRHSLLLLGEPRTSIAVLQLQELFSISEIADLPLQSLASLDEPDETDEESDNFETWTAEIARLIEGLFSTLSPTEMVMREAIVQQKATIATDDRDMVLVESQSSTSLPSLGSEPVNSILKIDIELIAAMQESLKDSKYAKYMEQKNPNFDARGLYREMTEQGRQMKYWSKELEADREQKTTPETHQAVMLNLARIAQIFESTLKPSKKNDELRQELQAAQNQCLESFPDLEEFFNTELQETDPTDALEILKSSNMELKKLAGSKAPEKDYTKDFTLSEKSKLTAAEAGSV